MERKERIGFRCRNWKEDEARRGIGNREWGIGLKLKKKWLTLGINRCSIVYEDILQSRK